MEKDEVDKTGVVGTSDDIDSRCAVNSLILDYYKKFGRKRDLEQYFSLSTAQSDIKDTSGSFWHKMKSENDSSDSGGRKSDSSHEVCRISIRCSLPEPSSSQDDEPATRMDSAPTSPQTVSPPIIIEEVPADASRQTDDESINLDDNNSQKSLDPLLDLSMNKPLSPTSSITSQRKLEWDSLADVGYANESDRKTSQSSLSTLERLALKQQYSNNDSKQDIGAPTSHSTPLDENEGKSKGKKGIGKKTTKIYKKDVDFVEVNVPHTSDTNQAPSINVNLTKHISFNVEKDGEITFDNVKRNINISPEKVSVETEPFPYLVMDKQIQTSLSKEKTSSKEKSSSMDETPKTVKTCNQKIPVMISLNTLRKRLRRKKTRVARRKIKNKKMVEKKEVTSQERSGEQLSEAESFEYMPGHMYNQNQMKDNEPKPDNSNGNKSSLESSGPLTTDSSKDSKHSLTKDLEKCVDLLKVTLQNRYDDGNTKKKLIKEIVHRLINSKYRDDETTTEFLSGLSYNSKKLGIKGNNTTTSTSDANNTDDSKRKRPQKSILRSDQFNPKVVASTSQSVPNLFTASSDKVNTSLLKTMASNTESDASSKGKTSSENCFPKTSSEELYLKYLEAFRREEAYKKHLKEKEQFLKQKLTSSENVLKASLRQESKINSRLKDLMKDLTRNNYDDGSGDASKLEGGSSINIDLERFSAPRNRSQSVFTLSSSLSECPKRPNLKKKMQAEREGGAGPSKNHYCCCPHHYMKPKVGCADSSVQVNIKYQCEGTACNEKPSQIKPKPIMPCDCKKVKPESPCTTRVVPDDVTGEIKYVCLCNGKQVSTSELGDNFMIYKCSRLPTRGVQIEYPLRVYNTAIQCENALKKDDRIELIQPPCKMNTATESSSSGHSSNARRYSKSSQTDVIGPRHGNENNYSSGSEVKNICGTSTRCIVAAANVKDAVTIHEATRCLQTEICINPKIADPTLSDIVIVNDCDCATLVAEQRRKVPLKFSEDSNKTKTYSDVSTNSHSGKLLIPSEDNLFREQIKTAKTSFNEMDNERELQSTATIANTYSIPFVDLTLRTGSVATADTKKTEPVNQGIMTSQVFMADEATSISEECEKTGPCCSSRSMDHNSNKRCSKEVSVTIKKPTSPRKNLRDNPKSNTYPKKDSVKEKPDFKRRNTDTVALSICTCNQTDKINQKDVETNNNQDIFSDQQVETLSATVRTNINCNKKNIGTQKDLSDEETQTCVEEKRKKICIETSEIITKNVGCETERETNINKKDKRCNVDCPDDKKDKRCCVDCPDDKKDKNCNVDCPDNKKDKRCNVDCPDNKKDKCCYVDCPDNKKDKHCNVDCPDNKKDIRCNVVCPDNKKDKCCYVECPDDKKDKHCNVDCPDNKKDIRCNVVCPDNKKDKCCYVECPDDKKDKHCNVDCPDNKKDIRCNVVCPDNKKDIRSNVECPGDCQGKNEIEDTKPCSSDCGPSETPECTPKESCCIKDYCPGITRNDPICEMIQGITHCFSKKEIVRIKKKKCFTEIMTVLNYLLETEDSTDPDQKTCNSTSTGSKTRSNKSKCHKMCKGDCSSEKQCDKPKQSNQCHTTSPCRTSRKDSKGTESSDLPCSSDLPTTSTDSAACKVFNKIKKECEKYHLRKCKGGRKCEASSSTSVNCEKCKKVHQCACRNHKCKRSKAFEKLKKKCIAYNLIIQTSESMLSDETVCEKKCRPLQNIIVKVPKHKNKAARHQEIPCSPRCCKNRSKSCPNESETSDECARRVELATVREYLEQNRPDFVERTSQRQNCLKFISERRATERSAQRDLLSLHVEQQPDLTKLNSDELLQLAQEIGINLRRRRPLPKLISEREMKKHSEKIYKTLPEVVQKKEEKKKENIKKTNLLMANIFKKNLQQQTLRGAVNLSNYSTVIKI